MKTLHRTALMKNRIHAILLGVACSLATAGVSHAMSELASITIEPEWPATTQPGTVTLYKITVTRAGQGLLEVSLSSLGLPEGATASFSDDMLRFTGRSPQSLTTTLTVTCTTVTPTDHYPFTVTGDAGRTVVTATNQTPNDLTGRSSVSISGPALALDRLADGSLKIRGHGSTGDTCQIEITADLIHPAWAPFGSSTADGNGRFIFTDTPAQNSPARFYRAVAPAPAATTTQP